MQSLLFERIRELFFQLYLSPFHCRLFRLFFHIWPLTLIIFELLLKVFLSLCLLCSLIIFGFLRLSIFNTFRFRRLISLINFLIRLLRSLITVICILLLHRRLIQMGHFCLAPIILWCWIITQVIICNAVVVRQLRHFIRFARVLLLFAATFLYAYCRATKTY